MATTQYATQFHAGAKYMPLTAVECLVVRDLVASAIDAADLRSKLSTAGFCEFLEDGSPIIGWIMGHLYELVSGDLLMASRIAGPYQFTGVEDNVIRGLMLQVEDELSYMYSDTQVDEYELPCFRAGFSSASYNALYKIRMLRYMHACGFSLVRAKYIADSTCSMVGYK